MSRLEQGPATELIPEHNTSENAIPKGFYLDDDFRSWAKFKTTFSLVPNCFEVTDGEIRKRAVGAKLVPDVGNQIAPFESAMLLLVKMARDTHAAGGTVLFCGNGGSAAICSHMAVDWTKNGGIRAMALHDAATLTCFGNDYGYEHVFAKQLEAYACEADMVVIISSSGRSPNVLATGRWCRDNRVRTVTLSGMEHTNELRRMGDLNFYVPCRDYGIVELAHTFLLHAVVSVKWPM